MNEVERLAKNIKVFIETGCLEEEMRTIAEENPHLDDLGELNDIMETETGICWPWRCGRSGRKAVSRRSAPCPRTCILWKS